MSAALPVLLGAGSQVAGLMGAGEVAEGLGAAGQIYQGLSGGGGGAKQPDIVYNPGTVIASTIPVQNSGPVRTRNAVSNGIQQANSGNISPIMGQSVNEDQETQRRLAQLYELYSQGRLG